MKTLPPEPSPGDKIKAELIRELIRAIRERTIIKGPNYALASGPNGTVVKFDMPRPTESENNPLPFEVRWDSSLDSGSGSWKIYLPDVESLCLVKEDYEEITGVTAIKDADGNDTDWYTIDDISSIGSEDVWLVVTVPDENSSATVTAELLSDEGQASTGEKVYNVYIAALEVVAATSSTPAEHNVRQYVDSAVIISGAADEVTPDDVSTEFIPDHSSGTQPDGDEGKLQIKGWKAGSAASNSIGTILSGNGGTGESAELMICRQSDGTLVFRPIGTVSGGGLSGSIHFVGATKYDVSSHQQQERIDTLNLATGAVTYGANNAALPENGTFTMITGGQAVPLSGE